MGLFSGRLGSGTPQQTPPVTTRLPAPPIDEQQRIDEASSRVHSTFTSLKQQLEKMPAFSAIRATADSITADTSARIRDIDAVAVGHSHIATGTQTKCLDSLIAKFVIDSNLFVGGSTDTFTEKLTQLVRATLEQQKVDLKSDPELDKRKSMLTADIEKFLDTEAGRPLIEIANKHRIAKLDHQIAQGHAIRIPPNPESPENRLKYATSLVSRIAFRDERK